jgi:phosphoribosylformylglycinamidine (FGAM) synthase-like enzyme
MAFAGGIGADVTGVCSPSGVSDTVTLFSESATRFVIEVSPENAAALESCLKDVPATRIGQTCKEPRLRIAGRNGEWVVWEQLSALKNSWQKPLQW